jgi:hypothetical protein
MNISDQKHVDWMQMMHRGAMNRLEYRERLACVRREEARPDHRPHRGGGRNDAPRSNRTPRH